MSLKLVSDPDNVVRLPQERRIAPSIESVRDMAPTPALVASIGSMRICGALDHTLRPIFRALASWPGKQ